MGKGDKRTRKGKINRGSYGKTRRPSNRTKKEQIVPIPPQAAVKPPAEPAQPQTPVPAAEEDK